MASELERGYERAKGPVEAYRLAYLLSRVQERRALYPEALEACERAFLSAKAFSIGKAPLIKESLAALCEEIGKECLNIGTPEHWDKAERLFDEAIRLRQELKRELSLEMEIAELRDIESLLQLARVKTHRRQLEEADAGYRDLLTRRLVRGKPLLRAQILKELADNYRFAGDEEHMNECFLQALEEYQSVLPRQLLDDPSGLIELHLNLGYCQRRLGDETAAVQSLQWALDLAHARRDRRRVAYACLQLARSSVVQAQPEEAAYYGLIAYQVMRRSSAKADAAHAEKLVDELAKNLTLDRRSELAARVTQSPFGAYLAAG